MFNRAKSISFQIDFHDINTKGTCRRWKFSNCSANAFARTFNFNYWNCQRVSNEKMLWALECNFVFFSFRQMHFSAQKVFSLLHVAAEWKLVSLMALICKVCKYKRHKQQGDGEEEWKLKKKRCLVRGRMKEFAVILLIAKYCFIRIATKYVFE